MAKRTRTTRHSRPVRPRPCRLGSAPPPSPQRPQPEANKRHPRQALSMRLPPAHAQRGRGPGPGQCPRPAAMVYISNGEGCPAGRDRALSPWRDGGRGSRGTGCRLGSERGDGREGRGGRARGLRWAARCLRARPLPGEPGGLCPASERRVSAAATVAADRPRASLRPGREPYVVLNSF